VLKGARGEAAEAERYFQNAQKFDPNNPVSYYYHARWLDSVGRTAEALELAQRALELSPGHVEAQQLLAAISGRQHQPAAASKERAPETPEQWLDRSLARYRSGRYRDSADAAMEALKLRPNYAEAHNNVCAAENAMGRFAAAVAACERALAINPNYPLARNNLAFAKTKLGK
jgi:tetratricopeptide (TPR) repeat protein